MRHLATTPAPSAPATGLRLLAAAVIGLAALGAQAGDDMPAMDHSHHHSMEGMTADEHAHHGHEGHAMVDGQDAKTSRASYTLPKLSLVRQDGTRVELARALGDGRPVVMNFIYTSCTAICPVTSQIFADFRAKLGADAKGVNVVSISIDPDYDTPQRLATYAGHFEADQNWSFYTGTLKDSVEVQKAFNTFRGDKMNHAPVTFMRAANSKEWVRIEGFANADVLLAEYRKLAKGS